MRRTDSFRMLVGLVGFSLACSTFLFSADKMKPEELINRHLDSIAKAEKRAEVKSRIAQSKIVFTEIIAHNFRIEGTSSLLSQGRKMKCAMQFGDPQYPGEQFVFDGQKIMVANIDQGNRSNLGAFLNQQTEVLRDGLFGGVLSTAWVLLNQKDVDGKLKYEGLKKIDGKEVHDLSYASREPSGGGRMNIHLYFEPETFRHVRTVYTVTQKSISGGTQEGTDETRKILEERFSDFAEADGFTLPRHWDVRFRAEPQTKPTEYQWDITIAGVQENPI